MVDLIAIKGAVDGLKAARDIAKSAIGLRDAAMLQGKVIELNDAIIAAQSSALDAQADQLTLAKRIEDLERQIAEAEKWDTEKQRYDLNEIIPGVYAFALKEAERGSTPAHHMCANCFNEGHLAILQEETRMPYHTKFLNCHRCGSEVVTEGMRREEHGKPPRRR